MLYCSHWDGSLKNMYVLVFILSYFYNKRLAKADVFLRFGIIEGTEKRMMPRAMLVTKVRKRKPKLCRLHLLNSVLIQFYWGWEERVPALSLHWQLFSVKFSFLILHQPHRNILCNRSLKQHLKQCSCSLVHLFTWVAISVKYIFCCLLQKKRNQT